MIGEGLRELRLSRNISMEQVEKMTGITNSRLSRIERDLNKHIALDDIVKLLKVFDVPLLAFLHSVGYCEVNTSVFKHVELLNDCEIVHIQNEIDFILKEKGKL